MAEHHHSQERPGPSTASTQSGSADDIVLPFRTVRSDVMGRLVRLGPSVDAILKRHDYPEPVAVALGEALALTALLGAAIKFEGRLILQTKSDGPLNFLVVNYDTPGSLRGYASYDKTWTAQLEATNTASDQAGLLGKGHLALTIDPDGDMERHQGIVPLDGQTLSEAALTYFRQSEQLPTFIRLGVAHHYAPPSVSIKAGSSGQEWSWRAGGLLLQHVTSEGGTPSTAAETEDDEKFLAGERDDDWQRTQMLAATVEDHELIDPTLAPETLLYRLFHEEGVRVVEPRRIEERCRCSRKRVKTFLSRFGPEELADMRETDGALSVTCEFCSTNYRFEPDALD